MKSGIIIKKRSCNAWSLYTPRIKNFIAFILLLTGVEGTLQAQVTDYTKPSWWFGAAAAANINLYSGSTQELNSGLTVPAAFHKGSGAGLYVAPLLEYHRPDTRFGFMFQLGYDSRRASFKEVTTPCNCPADLSTKLSYFTVEPSLRIAPFKSDFYLFVGPRVAFNLNKSFKYQLGINPDVPTQTKSAEVKGDFSNINSTIFSMQIGAGYDIALSAKNKQTQAVLSPFVSFHPYFGQSPRTIETWNVTTVRTGLAIKFGRGRKMAAVATAPLPTEAAVVTEPAVNFSVTAPANIAVERRVTEIFPLRNYVFFNTGSTEIPDRYKLLRKDQVTDFKEDQVAFVTPENLTGRSSRQMIVYYNVINILGDRMGKNPSAAITLVGSSELGPDDGKAMAESIKQYLVTVFGIDAARITIEGRNKPKIPSEKPGGTNELVLLREGDRRVSIESSSASLLMEFQTGPDAPLKPVEILAMQQEPQTNYVSFNVEGATEAYTSWSLEIKDDKAVVQNFGPYTQEKISISGNSILGTRSEGDFTVTLIGKTKSGNTIKKETPLHLVRWTASKDEEGMRFSVLFEFNESKTIALYEKYLTDVVLPKIPTGGTVMIHGHTDVIGEELHNQTLSMARANEVKTILENGLIKAGRTDVKFEVLGFGEDQSHSPFENKFPEERFYNRTVIIDIIPGK